MVARSGADTKSISNVEGMTVDIPVDTAERSEANALYDLLSAASPADRQALGITQTRVAGGIVNSTSTDTTGFWSKALGFGFDEPVTDEVIAEVCAFYREAGTPKAVLQLAPSVLPADWAEIAARQGITAGAKWVKVVADVETVTAKTVETKGLRVGPVSPVDGPKWTATMLEVFGMDDAMAPAFVASTTRPGWQPFAAWLD